MYQVINIFLFADIHFFLKCHGDWPQSSKIAIKGNQSSNLCNIDLLNLNWILAIDNSSKLFKRMFLVLYVLICSRYC